MSTPKQENKSITLNEFKSWLQGIKDMLGNEWTPTTDQWKLICEKIDNLKETPALAPLVASGPPPSYQPNVIPRPAMVPAAPAGPSSFTGTVAPQIPQMPQMMHSGGGMPAPNLKGPMATGMVGSSVGMPVKTPTIDTSNGKYDSTFE